jgi:energy-coupling factor transporter ATP-binding protein EcfA2
MKACDNPFAVERIRAIRYPPLQGTLDALLARLQELNCRAAIIGPDGSGKTTLLEDLQRAFTEKGRKTRMVFVNDTCPLDAPACRRLLSELTREEIVLLDGADLIPRFCWSLTKRHTIRHAFGLIITSHRPGLLPALLECSTTPALLDEITRALLPPGHTIPPDQLAGLFKRHQGNLRACLRELYDLYGMV